MSKDSLLTALGGRCITATSDPSERTFLFQRLSMAIQRGNVACFSGSLHHGLFSPILFQLNTGCGGG